MFFLVSLENWCLVHICLLYALIYQSISLILRSLVLFSSKNIESGRSFAHHGSQPGRLPRTLMIFPNDFLQRQTQPVNLLTNSLRTAFQLRKLLLLSFRLRKIIERLGGRISFLEIQFEG